MGIAADVASRSLEDVLKVRTSGTGRVAGREYARSADGSNREAVMVGDSLHRLQRADEV